MASQAGNVLSAALIAPWIWVPIARSVPANTPTSMYLASHMRWWAATALSVVTMYGTDTRWL